METLGNKIKSYKPDTMKATVAKCLSVLMILLGIGCIALYSELGSKALLYVAAGIGGGIYVFYLGNKMKPKFGFDLYERGIVARSGKQSDTLLFAEIEDTAYFQYGKGLGFVNFGFRKTERDDWYLISPEIMQEMDLIQQFRNQHLSCRFPVVEKKVNNNGQAIFRTVTRKDAFVANIMKATADSMLKEYTGKVIVDKNKLEIDGKFIERSEIQSAAVTGNGDIILYGKTNEQILTIPYTGITSPDILIELLNER